MLATTRHTVQTVLRPIGPVAPTALTHLKLYTPPPPPGDSPFRRVAVAPSITRPPSCRIGSRPCAPSSQKNRWLWADPQHPPGPRVPVSQLQSALWHGGRGEGYGCIRDANLIRFLPGGSRHRPRPSLGWGVLPHTRHAERNKEDGSPRDAAVPVSAGPGRGRGQSQGNGQDSGLPCGNNSVPVPAWGVGQGQRERRRPHRRASGPEADGEPGWAPAAVWTPPRVGATG